MGFVSFTLSYIFFSIVHIVGLALALTVCGLYGKDLNNANHQDKYADSKWVYAVVVGGISAVTCVLYLVPFILSVAGIIVPIWNAVLFILWIAVFGVFGSMYINEDAEGDGGIERMKSAVWVDLANALLWLLVAIGAFGYWWKHRDTRSRFTGRAHV